jgi:hypothetical protein
MANFYDILKNVCILAHEEKPSSFSSSGSPYGEIKQYINDILEEVCSKFYWTFRERSFSLTTTAGQKEYSLPSGANTSGLIENGVRVEGTTQPLYFIIHSDLDMLTESNGKPYRYSVFSDKLILDPTPDKAYELNIKYLTVNFAYSADKTQEKAKLELETDVPIIPDRFVKVIEWGAYSLYRQNYKPDNKYKLARDKYLEFLIDMQKQDGHSGDDSPFIVINQGIRINSEQRFDF